MVDLLSNGYSAGMKELGDLFGMGEIFLPELIFATEVMKTVSAEIESKMDMSEVKSAGTLVIGTVEGDVHDIGKESLHHWLKPTGLKYLTLAEKFQQRISLMPLSSTMQNSWKLSAADDYNDSTERHRRSSERSWYQRQSKDHDRRSACNQSLGRKDRC